MEKPHRRFELTIKVSADEWKYALADLKDLVDHVEEHGPNCASVMGGPVAGHIVSVVEDPDMTHDKYFEQLDLWLKEQP